MIYSTEECNLIQNVEYRKTLERSIYSLDAFPISFKSAMDCQLELDIKRCGAM